MKQMIEELLSGKRLSRNEARELLIKLLSDGGAAPVQVAAILTIFRQRGVELDELCGFHDAMMSLATSADLGTREAVDLCGTGGDGKRSFNVSTVAAFVVAASGGKVIKHGNYAASSLCGSSNVLEALGIKLTADQDLLRRQLETTGVCFLHAPLFHPALKGIAPIRKKLGFRTVFNLLGPLANPARPLRQLCGVSSVEIARLYLYFAQREERSMMIVHSLDGFDEVSLTAEFLALSPTASKTMQPEEFGLPRLNEQDLSGADNAAEGAKICRAILFNEATPAQRAVVEINSAFALRELRRERSLSDCLAAAREAIESGRARQTFERLLATQQGS